jgi:glycosyltransferase involved in cell wall biosynthesis
MRIGIDARMLGTKQRGVGRYVQMLVEHLAKLETQDTEFYIFLRTENWHEFTPPTDKFKKVLADYKWYGLAEQILWPLKLYRQKVDLMHFTFFNVPIIYFHSYVVTIHDLQMYLLPSSRATTKNLLAYWLKYLLMRLVTWSAVKRAYQVIVPSEFVKSQLLRIFNIQPKKIVVIYEGAQPRVSKQLSRSAVQSVLSKYKIEKPFILYVGAAYPHKNLARLVKAHRILKNKFRWSGQLVLVGPSDYFYKRLEKSLTYSEKNDIVFTGFTTDSELFCLYQAGVFFVMPSLAEGFGLPPLEAQSCQCPVAAARAGSLPEVLGASAVYFDPFNIEAIARTLNNVLTNRLLADSLRQKGKVNVKRFSWSKAAAQTLAIYHKA